MREQREGREEGRVVHCVLTGQNNQDGTGFDLRAGENRNGMCYYTLDPVYTELSTKW